MWSFYTCHFITGADMALVRYGHHCPVHQGKEYLTVVSRIACLLTGQVHTRFVHVWQQSSYISVMYPCTTCNLNTVNASFPSRVRVGVIALVRKSGISMNENIELINTIVVMHSEHTADWYCTLAVCDGWYYVQSIIPSFPGLVFVLGGVPLR